MDKEPRRVTIVIPRNWTLIKYFYLIIFLIHLGVNIFTIIRVGQIRCYINGVRDKDGVSVGIDYEQKTQIVNTVLNCLIVAFILHQLLSVIGFFTKNLASLVASIFFNILWFSFGIYVSSAKINGLTFTTLKEAKNLPKIVPISITSTVFSFLAIISTLLFIHKILSRNKS